MNPLLADALTLFKKYRAVVAERDQALAERDQALAERDKALAELDKLAKKSTKDDK